ncbi:MAG: diacylglycerol kinase [Deltaproteobacteria bacterium HGW-Deltaproteobacteria-4]|nr:MAG: diacylglycerol kinase [Deltaproteobacteria bacterium HGW-Deltaproteobacteria-4]
MKPSRWLESVNCAIEGILWTARSQKHMRWHFLSAAAVLFAALFFKVPTVDFLLLTLAITVVLFAEIINTAVEVVVDLVSPDFHPLAKQAKDVAAGAVLLATCGAAVVGYVVFSSRIFSAVPGKERMIADVPGDVAVVSILIVTIAVILLKAHFAKGRPLHGGMPSGHAAVAFAIAVAIVFSGATLIIDLCAFTLAAMVSQSRLLMKIHTLGEVLFGALLGSCLALFLHLLL